MKIFKIVGVVFLVLIVMDALYVGYSQATSSQNAYVAQDDTSDDF